MFYDENRCLYVGKADCIGSRVRHHLGRMRGYRRFAALNVGEHVMGLDYKNTKHYLHMMEAYFIHMERPVMNRVRPDIGKLIHEPKDGCETAWELFRERIYYPAISRLT